MTWAELSALAIGLILISMAAKLVRRHADELGSTPGQIPAHGPTEILTLENGRKVYVGRAGSRPWVQLPTLEQGFNPTEGRLLAQAITTHSESALAYEVQNTPKEEKALTDRKRSV